jgi:hypothetical protein
MRRPLPLALALWFACLLPAPATASPEDACLADSELAYLCGVQRPEDLVAIPGTDWLVASGFSPGAGLKLVNAATRQARMWYDGSAAQIAPLADAFPACPGPPDPATFHTRGLSLREKDGGGWRLLVVNHGGRESIEVFDITLDQGEPRLAWRGCLPMPPGQVANSVAAFADGTVLATVLTRPGTTIGDFMLGRVTGAVWQWQPGDAAFTELPGTRLPGNNGIETDPDQMHFYVVSFGLHVVARFSRHDPSAPLSLIVAPDFMPDNIRWSDGRLLLAGMRLDEPACGGLRQVVDGVADPMLCHRGWVVGELLPGENRIATVAYGHPQPGFNGHSVAVIRQGELWLGSFQSDRIAIVRDWTNPD